MALNLFRKKDKTSPSATTTPETETDPGLAADDQAHDEPLSFQEVEDGEASEADLPEGMAAEPAGRRSLGGASATTVQRKRTRAHTGGTPAKGRRAARGKARSRTASRARPARKRAPARKANQRKRTSAKKR